MKVRSARLLPLRLFLRRPVVTTHGTLRQRRGWLLCLEGEGAVPALGEATPLPGFGTESEEACEAALRCALGSVEGLDAEDPIARATLLEGFEATPVARAALECALLDLAGRAQGLALADLLQPPVAPVVRRIPLSALILAEAPEAVAAETARAVAAGFRAAKLKLSRSDPERDHARLAAARSGGGPALALRGDANGAWLLGDARARLESLVPLGLDYVEQPLPREAVEELATLRGQVPVPIAADESATSQVGLARVLAAGAADVVILKPSILGPETAVRMAARAREAGVRSVVTSLLDGGVAHHAAAQVAARLGAEEPSGLATGTAVSGDRVAPPACQDGALLLSAAPGLGLALPLPGAGEPTS